MAKVHRESKPAKVRVFYYGEVEGSDETIKDGLRTLATALVRAVQPTLPAIRVIKSLPSTAPNGDGKAAEPTLFDQPGQRSDDGATIEDVEVLDVEPAGDSEDEINRKDSNQRDWPRP